MVLGATFLARLFGMPSELLRFAGISLFPFTAFLIFMTSRQRLSLAVVWTVIVVNALWTADSFLIIASGWITPTPLGYAFVTGQAMGVAMFAGLEYVGLRKSAAAAMS